MRRTLAAVLLLFAAIASAATTNNDDSCDIAVQPAATLLLSYFEVDFRTPRSRTTVLFTIQNVSPSPRIANVTLWTDWGFPAFNFPIHLTGYDVQGINLYDLFAHGEIPQTECSAGMVSASLLTDLQLMFTTGRGNGTALPCTAQVGGTHPNAIGYATIDVVNTCAAADTGSRAWFANLLHDNVLTGDDQQLDHVGSYVYASGGPLVHIRAIPEGGAAGAVVATSLPYTFYDRFTPTPAMRKSDRRQPLPSLFAPRFINGGSGYLNTTLKIWREGVTVGACSDAGQAASIRTWRSPRSCASTSTRTRQSLTSAAASPARPAWADRAIAMRIHVGRASARPGRDESRPTQNYALTARNARMRLHASSSASKSFA